MHKSGLTNETHVISASSSTPWFIKTGGRTETGDSKAQSFEIMKLRAEDLSLMVTLPEMQGRDEVLVNKTKLLQIIVNVCVVYYR